MKYDETYWEKGLKRNNLVYSFLRKTLGIYYTKRFKFTFEPFEIKSETFLLFSNHTNDNDPFFQALMFKQPLRYVAAESLLRSKPWGKIISFLVNPIPRKKASSADDTINYIQTNLKLGINVAMFPEGVKTINGRTGHISERTGKLVKDAVGGLVLCRFSGAYMCAPIWAENKRRGPVKGVLVREFTRDELDKMSVEEINKAINDNLYINAYEEQRHENIIYKGKDLAKGLENALYVCPKCKRVGRLRGSGDNFICSCGYCVKLNDKGFFEGENAIFDDLLKWDLWQRNYIAKQTAFWLNNEDEEISFDEALSLYEIESGKKILLASNARLSCYPKKLAFKNKDISLAFQFDTITHMSNFKSTSLLFTYNGKYYEASKAQWPVFKYIALFRILTGQAYD